ncbi:hypothetical protein CEV32_1294 [Brucella rhizosphaerae]|uniref:Uncharacterized protein n=1 Tax=Brucella rhizosphaerae TaxID=571254 RepID=A0A256FA89_9HYPH|nr:hypothetical protein CEV32_1294 [Brucella rhizosphaerae]
MKLSATQLSPMRLIVRYYYTVKANRLFDKNEQKYPYNRSVNADI